MTNLSDKIWITAHIRMYSEKRYKRYDISSHIFLSYLSFLLIVGSIFSGDLGKHLVHFDKLMITLSLLVFGTSLIIYGFKFGEKSNQYRECYLKLQALENNLGNVSNPEKEYASILDCYPNHSDWDFHDFIISKTLILGGKVTSGGEHISWSSFMLLTKLFRFVAYCSILFLPPTVISYLSVLPFVPTPSP